MMDLSAFLGEFRAEAAEHLQRLDDRLLALERDPTSSGAIRDMFISAHTIKGGASMLGLDDIREVAHALEDVLARLRDRGDPLDQPTADLLFRAVDILRDCVAAASLPGSPLDPSDVEIVAALRARATLEPELEVAELVADYGTRSSDRPRAMVIEASPTVSLLESLLLSEAGFDVDTAPDGRHGLEQALLGGHRLVVAGLETPDIPGQELVAVLRADPRTRHLPVILTTSHDPLDAAPRVVEPGREVHIPKGSLTSQQLVEVALALVSSSAPELAARARGGRDHSDEGTST